MGELQQYKKFFIFLGLIIFAGTFALFSITLYQRVGKVGIAVRTLPDDSAVLLNNTQTNSGVTYVEPGTYTVIVKKDGFANFQQTIAVAQNNPVTINAALIPVSDKAKDWVKKHESEYAQFTTAKETIREDNEAKIRNNNPITQKLPYRNLLYSISYRADETDPNGTSIIIEIDTSRAYREAALFQIRKWNYDPTDFRIEFKGYTNPITS